METAIREYDAKVDSKRRLTLKKGAFEYYHVSEMADGRIILEPRELSVPFSVSKNTLNMMDEAIHNYKNGVVSDPVDLSDF